MDKRGTLICLAVCLGLTPCLKIYAQVQAPPAPRAAQKPAPTDDPMYHLRRSTVSLGRVTVVNGKQTFNTIGSAVIVTTDGRHACLLTAKHVLYQPAIGYIPDQLWIRVAKDQPFSANDFGVPIPLIVGGKAIWNGADDGSDLAVAPLPDLSKYPNLHAISIQDFGTDDDIYQGATVIILGYPALLGEAYLATPIARNGIIAWTDPDGLDRPFLVDANVFEGNSGGPVFHSRSGIQRYGGMSLGGGFGFIGIVSQDAREYAQVIGAGPQGPFISTSPDPATGKPSPIFAEVKNIGGIGVIEPASKAKRLVLQVLPAPATSPKPLTAP